nr:MAG TPA: hypothetical protein [Caudoviricetes sp.]
MNIAEKDWKNNNRTEAFFDLLELPMNSTLSLNNCFFFL